MTLEISLERLLDKIDSVPTRNCLVEGGKITIIHMLRGDYTVFFEEDTLPTYEFGYRICIRDPEFGILNIPIVQFIGKDSSTSDYEKMRRAFIALKIRIEEDFERGYEAFRQKRQRSLRDDFKDLLDE